MVEEWETECFSEHNVFLSSLPVQLVVSLAEEEREREIEMQRKRKRERERCRGREREIEAEEELDVSDERVCLMASFTQAYHGGPLEGSSPEEEEKDSWSHGP